MEEIFASLAALVWHSLVGRNDGVADRTLCLSLQGCDDVLLKDGKAIGNGAILQMNQ